MATQSAIWGKHMSIRQHVTDSQNFKRSTFRVQSLRVKSPFRETDLNCVASVLSIVYLTGRIFLMMFIFVFGIVGGSKILSSNTSDPLASYEGIMLGESDVMLKTSHYQPAPISASDQSGVEYYVTEPDDSAIEKILVGSRNGTIQRVTFFLNRLQFGYLVLRWGQPDVVNVRPQRYIARWESGVGLRTSCHWQKR